MPERQSSTHPLQTFTAQELQSMNFPPLRWIVDEILPEGLALLLAPPKYGKSWFAQQLCYAVAAGRPFLGFNVSRGSTLYLALESSQRQLQDRQAAFCGDDESAPPDFHMAVSAERLDTGIIDQLRQFVVQHPQTVLIVIDLLAKIRAQERAGSNAYYADYDVMTPLKRLSDEFSICVLVLHHARKIVDETDFLNNSSGSNGLTGAVDTFIGIEREKREDASSVIHVTGRDVETNSFHATFDRETRYWKRIGAPLTPTTDPLIRAIQALLHAHPDGWQGTMSDFITETGYSASGKDPARSAGRHLTKLTNQLAAVGISYESFRTDSRMVRFWTARQEGE